MDSTIPPPRLRKADPLVGTVVNGKFRIDALIASGGMGTVYRAEQIALGRPVALKVLHVPGAVHGGSTADDPHFEKRFFREASILARLQHPNIVTVFDYGAIEGLDDERYFMALEFLSGETLADRIQSSRGLTAAATVPIARQIARGLTEAHAQGVVHRDLKPSNVMLVAGRDGEELVKIVDFGIVKILGEADTQELTVEGSFVGSPRYMAPEQIDESASVDARCDLYSFGIILYECLAGRVPFDASTSMKTLMAHLNEAPRPLHERALGIPEWLEDLVMQCIEKDRHRPTSMAAIGRALAEGEASLASGGAPSSSARAFGPAAAQLARTGVTERGTIASLRPPARQPRRTGEVPPRGASPLALGLAIVASALAVALVVLVRSKSTHGGPAVTSASVAAPAPTAFLLTLTSSPSGAEVTEGDRRLGLTPLEVPVDNAVVSREPRRFIVSRDGYAPFTIVQGPSDTGVRLLASLVEAPSSSPPTIPVATEATATRRAPVSRPSTSAAPTGSGLDIRLSR